MVRIICLLCFSCFGDADIVKNTDFIVFLLIFGRRDGEHVAFIVFLLIFGRRDGEQHCFYCVCVDLWT